MDRRKKRTSTNQYMMYIDLMEKDPIFASGKVPRDVDLNYLTKQWKDLSDKLNQCNSGPTLTAEEWRKRLNDWKNTTRSKYRRSLSGEKDIAMTTLELKALDLFGKVPQMSAADQVSLHLKSEKDEGEDEMEHQRTSETFQKELQAAVEEAIGGNDEDVDNIIEEHDEQDDEILEEALNTASANATNAADTSNDDVTNNDGGSYRTIVVDNSSYVEEHADEQVEYITSSKRVPHTTSATSVQTVVASTAPANTKLINGGIPLKRLRTQTREQIVYEMKNAPVQPPTLTPRTYATMQQSTPSPIAIHQNKAVLPPIAGTLRIDTQEARGIAEQLKRLADIKHEKLKFEVARFKFNNPGFQYNYPPAL